MFAGPIIAREVLTSPRPVRFYVTRAAFAIGMFILMWTAWQAFVGWQDVGEVGTLARFGGVLYFIFAMLQLTLMLFFAPLGAATAVAHEKDRRTFVLLMMTDLSDLEIVLGKLLASFLLIVTVLAAGIPVLSVCALARWDLAGTGSQPVRRDGRQWPGRWGDGTGGGPVAGPHVPVGFADDPDGGLIGCGG